jgi:RNA polymerase sigma-70 factor (ECF subfamily)
VTTEITRGEEPAGSCAMEPSPRAGLTADQAGIEALAERARDGCRDSFEALVAHFEKRIYHYIYQMTRNEHDAQDLTQITFLKAYQHLPGYESRGRFHTWLFTIAKRTALNHFRGARPVEELWPDLPASTDDPSVQVELKDACSDVWRLARSLKPDQYEVLWLRYGEGFSITETARVMKTNSLRVRVLVHRARAGLRKLLSQEQARIRLGLRTMPK